MQGFTDIAHVCPLTVPAAVVESEEFMNSKKSHEVQAMSEVVASLAQRCRVKQVKDTTGSHFSRHKTEENTQTD